MSEQSHGPTFSATLPPWQPAMMNCTFRPGATVNLPSLSCCQAFYQRQQGRKDGTGLLLLRVQYCRLYPSLSSIFRFCPATEVIQNRTASYGALCTVWCSVHSEISRCLLFLPLHLCPSLVCQYKALRNHQDSSSAH